MTQPGSPHKRERDPSLPATAHGRGAQSKKTVAGLEDRLTHVELAVGSMIERLTTFENGASQIEEDISIFYVQVAEVESQLEDVRDVEKHLMTVT